MVPAAESPLMTTVEVSLRATPLVNVISGASMCMDVIGAVVPVAGVVIIDGSIVAASWF